MQALTAERFSETFFRPTKKLHHPKKNALPEEKPEDVKFVQILTEKPPSVESSRSLPSLSSSISKSVKILTATVF